VLGQARRLIGSVGRHDEDPRSEYGRWSCWVCGRWIAERRGGMRYRYPHADTCEIGAALAALDAAMDECGPER
jgi:hypothetical protein